MLARETLTARGPTTAYSNCALTDHAILGVGKIRTVLQALRWLTTVYSTCALMDHKHHVTSGVGKILHRITSFKVGHNSL